MDSKLQQAIAATRAGNYVTAQHLLTDTLQQDPKDANAWFLLSHLVISPERQARFLEYTLVLQPDHKLANEHLERLINPDVPPPVISSVSNRDSGATYQTPPPTIDSEFSPIPPARTDPVMTVSNGSETTASETASGSPEIVIAQDSKSTDMNWSKTAGSPKRNSQIAEVPQVPKREAPAVAKRDAPVVRPSQPKTVEVPAPSSQKQQSANKWLVAILIILVALAFFFMSFLAYMFFFQ